MALFYEYPETFKVDKELHELLNRLSSKYLDELNKSKKELDYNFRMIRTKSELIRWLISYSLNNGALPKELKEKIFEGEKDD